MDSDIKLKIFGVAFQAPPGSQASSRGEAKDSALLSSRDAARHGGTSNSCFISGSRPPNVSGAPVGGEQRLWVRRTLSSAAGSPGAGGLFSSPVLTCMSIPSKYQDAQRYSEKPKALSSLRTDENQGMGKIGRAHV